MSLPFDCVSTNTPATFLRPTTTSFGHLTFAGTPNLAIVLAIASAPTRGSEPIDDMWAICLVRILSQIPPFGEYHT
jgi:hypothetical protein